MSRRKHSVAAPLVAGFLLLASAPTLVSAHPYPLQNVANNLFYELGDKFMKRDCVQRCGVDSQYCCGSGEQCYTVNNIAGCSTINGGGGYGIFTTTWTETNTFTSTITTDWPATTKAGGGGAGGTCVPQHEGETACGSICCAVYQYCAYEGQCAQRAGWGGGITTVTSGGVTITTQFSAPYRITSTAATGTFASATATGTGTVVPVTDEGTGGGLSGGAIAGIVIGTLAGLGLLMLLCFCCIARGLWGLIFGGKKKKEHSRERVEVVEERYSRHGSRMPSAHSHRPSHTGWFAGGGRPAPAARRNEEKKEGAKWLGLGAAAATLLALLNVKKDKPARKPRSSYTDSYYSYTGTSPSESSSDSRTRSDLTSYLGSSSSGGRTHRTGQTRGTRTTRHSRR
ncbi:uncharacterized protein GLRG_03901 [Colletotrichum graminicola M1.001]|uniref:Glycophorin A domain-containing protein n=1 Tax=Colletotrichum graminicola (strain M1.001 / M2 / FGSC 10212) TaxID=645133 RepID=E3QCY5_COLGM|nr:uncharacterized protein GLRG_03901 [Colletotrichum graminicola M1.001]EFQ28757.1 hypothetical protein GLRG_03901 [Colletotrichum graminicola M1.001]